MPRGCRLPSTASLLAAAWLGLLVLGITPRPACAVPTADLAESRVADGISAWTGSSDGAGQKALGHSRDDDDGAEPRDGFRWTSRGFASLGDSYSAGIGTHLDGNKEESCRLGYGAYPALLHNELEPGRDTGKDRTNITTFQWLSCTGSTTADVMGSSPRPASSWERLWSWVSSWFGLGSAAAASASALASAPGQIDSLLTDPADAALDFVTLSVGGNDVGFFDVINACIFRFYGYYSGTCDAALLASEALIAQDDAAPDSFAARLALILLQILERARWEKRPRFRIVVTGYARFFNSETDACSACSMSVWWHHGNATGTPAGSNTTDTTYLTKGLRRRMNDLVARTNRKLQAVVDGVNRRYTGAPGADGPRVLFVDYDTAFDGHRFCEDGVVEPDYARNETWFFLVGGADSDVGDVERFATVDPASPLVDPDRCRLPADARGDWGERALCDLVQARAADPGLLSAAEAAALDDGGLVGDNAMWYVPTYYGKTFHPRSSGHKAIRDAVYRVWEEHGL